jgi:hypothetical protein
MKRFWLICITGLFMTACKKETASHDETSPPPAPPVQGTLAITAVGNPAGAAVQKTIGASGGTIISSDGKARLIIPAGALESNQSITMQPIEGTAPLSLNACSYRFSPHGLQFKKPAQLVVNYANELSPGTSPELVNIATQQDNGSWKIAGKVTVDKNNKTMTTEIKHFSDYDYFLEIGLVDDKTGGDTALLRLLVREEVGLQIKYLVAADDSSLLVSMPPVALVNQWTVNGVASPPVTSEYGYFKDQPEHLRKLYVAPEKRKAGDTISVSVELKMGQRGLFYMIRQVVIVDVNQLKINGKSFDDVISAANIINGNLTIVLSNVSSPTSKPGGISVLIYGVHGPGVYPFSGTVVAGGVDGVEQWDSYYVDKNGNNVYGGGGVTITKGGNGEGPLEGRIEGTLYVKRGQDIKSGPVQASFGVIAH